MRNYEEVGKALDLFLEGRAISYNQLKIIQKIGEIEEIKDIEARLTSFPGMEGLRKGGWMNSNIEVFGAVDDKKILNYLVNPPEGEGIVDFLKKNDLSQYLYSGPCQTINGMFANLCVGGTPDINVKMDDIHYHIRLELLTRKEFNSGFGRIRKERAKLPEYTSNRHLE